MAALSTEEVRVLHVDDDPDFADLAGAHLERVDERFAVTSALNASEALDILDDEAIDCIVSDYDMPGLNGIELLKEVRADNPDLPFILFTGKGSEEVASDALSAGGTDYLQKESSYGQYEILANRILNAVEQYRASERAANLDRIRSLLVDINQALVRASSREEIESEVCQIISDAEPYRFAWLGEVDSETAEIEPREWAGIDEGYLDEITVKADESSRGQGPGGTAARERRVAVAQDVHATPAFEPWREAASERGFRSVAAFPLESNGELYGVLLVYANRPEAFDEDERELLAELGDDIGHAIHHQQVKHQLQLFRQAVEASGHSIYVTDPSGEIKYVNPAFEETTGYTADEAVGRNPRILRSGEHDQEFYERLWETILSGDVWRSEVTNTKRSGETYVVDQTIAPVTDDSGEISHFVAVNANITDHKGREEKLREARNRREALFQNPNNAIIETEFEGDSLVIQETNRTFLEVFDYERDAVVGTSVGEVLVPDEDDAQARYDEIKRRVYEGEGIDTEVRRRTRHGSREFRLSVFPIDIADGQRGGYAIYTDITERKDREQRLERYETIIEASGDAVYMLDPGGHFTFVNEALTEITGYSEDELLGEHVSKVIGEEDIETGTSLILELIDGEKSRGKFEMTAYTADGEAIPMENHIAVITTADGSLEASAGIVRDVSERKAREERLEQFSSLVSHDLRNPLSVAGGSLELARADCESEHLDRVAGSLDRMETLIEDLLAWARMGERVEVKEPVDVSTLVEGCWQTVPTADAQLRTATDLSIIADRSRLQQLIENLLRNAVEHGGGSVTVTVGELADEDGFYVADDGPGIPQDAREDVFQSGYSRKDDGTGLGLTIVGEIVDAHGWDVRVTEHETGGARFEISGVGVV